MTPTPDPASREQQIKARLEQVKRYADEVAWEIHGYATHLLAENERLQAELREAQHRERKRLVEIETLRQEIAEAREACPAIRMDRFADAPILDLVNEQVSQLFRMQSRAEQAEATLRQAELELSEERSECEAAWRCNKIAEEALEAERTAHAETRKERDARIEPLAVSDDPEEAEAIRHTPEYVLMTRRAADRQAELHHGWRRERDEARAEIVRLKEALSRVIESGISVKERHKRIAEAEEALAAVPTSGAPRPARCPYCDADTQDIADTGKHRKGCMLNDVRPATTGAPQPTEETR